LTVLSSLFTDTESKEQEDVTSCPRAPSKAVVGLETQPAALPRHRCSSMVAQGLTENCSLSGLTHLPSASANAREEPGTCGWGVQQL